MKINYIIPYALDKDLGKEYNRHMKAIRSKNDWAVFVDGDAMFTHSFWGQIISDIITDNPEAKIFTCMTNRVGTRYQCVPNVWEEQSMEKHWEIGKREFSKHGTKLSDITFENLFSGVLIAIKKSHWENIGGFTEGIGMLGVDNSIHEKTRKFGEKMYLAKGLYVLHWYRNGLAQNKNHLI